MRERLKELDIRITELSEYLHISRPTLYKFIKKYEDGKTRGIDSRVMDLFRYIDENPDIGKKNVITFIVNNCTEDSISILTEQIKDYEKSKRENTAKSKIISALASSSDLDLLVSYLDSYISEKTGYCEFDLNEFLEYITKNLDENSETV